MVNYKDGKIYKIISNQTDKIYIGGSAEKYLSNRLASHRGGCNLWKKGKTRYISSFEIVQYPDHKIILIEKYPCDDKDQLRAREQYWIDQFKDRCVNILNAKLNVEKYREKNSKRKKEWYQKNREREIKRVKMYTEKNRDRILAYKRKKVKCMCGKEYATSHKKEHYRSIFHKTKEFEMIVELNEEARERYKKAIEELEKKIY